MSTAGGRGHRALRRVRAAHQRDRVQPCWRRGQPIDYSVPANTTPASYTLGHRVAIARGGDLLDPGNLAPEHAACNSAARDSDTRPLGSPSRNW